MNRPKMWIVLVLTVAGVAVGLAVGLLNEGPGRASNVRMLRTEETGMVLGESVTRDDFEHELIALRGELSKNPNHIPILLRMAQVSGILGRQAEGIEHLREAARIEPSKPEVLLELGRVLHETGDITGALTETRRVLELDPSNVDGLYNLGAIYGNMMQDELAREYWTRAVSLAPDSDSGRLAAAGLDRLVPANHPALPAGR